MGWLVALVFQLGFDNLVKVRWLPTSKKLRYILTFANVNRRSIFYLAVHLPIGGEDPILRAGENLQFDIGVWRQDQRAVGGEMRCDR